MNTNAMQRTGGELAAVSAGREGDPAGAFLAGKRSAATRDAYRRDLGHLAQFIGAADLRALLAVTVGELAAWRDAMTAAGLAPATVARRLSAARAFGRFAVAVGAAQHNPALHVEGPTVEAHKARSPWIDRAGARALLDAPSAATVKGQRDRAILELLLRLGLRRAELCGLTVASLDTSAAGGCWTLTVTGKRGKVRTLAMNGAARTVAAYLAAAGRDLASEPPSKPLFPGRGGRPMSGDNLRRLVRHYAELAGVEVNGGERMSAHACRRTFAVVAIDAGASMEALRRAMGHASVATTSRYDKRADADLTVSY